MLTPAARVNKPFSSEGGVMLTLYTIFPEGFTTNTPLFARIDGLDVPLYCTSFERRGRSGALVHFADLDTTLRTAELIGKELRLDLEEVEDEPDDTFYMEDLIGFCATGEGFSGKVTDYYDSEANPLLEVTTDAGAQVLVPAAEEFIERIDFKKRKISFLLPDGLIELNAKQG